MIHKNSITIKCKITIVDTVNRIKKNSLVNSIIIQGVPKKGNRSSKVNYFKDTKFVNYALE